MRRLLLFSTLLAFAAPAAAQAAFAPKLTATISPTTPATPAGISTVITQAVSETPQKKVVVTFPKELGINQTTTAKNCSDADVAAKSCPADSKLGSADATAAGLGLGLGLRLSGNVNLGEVTATGIKLIVYLKGSGQDMTLTGLIEFTENGMTTTFDNLPNVPVTSLTLTLDNGPQTLIATPDVCGTFNIKADFLSQKDETATSAAPFTIAGCPPPDVPKPAKPRLAALKVTKHLTTKARGRLTFRLSKKARVLIRLTKSGRVVSSTRVAGHKGANSRKLPKLAKGKYLITLTATDSGKRKGSAKVRFTVRKPVVKHKHRKTRKK